MELIVFSLVELFQASKCSAELRTFWSNRKTSNLQRDLQHVELRKQLTLSHIEAEDVNVLTVTHITVVLSTTDSFLLVELRPRPQSGTERAFYGNWEQKT